jgi:hypothetical protein
MAHEQDDERAAAILSRRAAGLLALDEVLAELADANCSATIAAVIAERLRLQPQTISTALEADSDESISVMCRAAGFSLNGFSALLRMRRRRNTGTKGASDAMAFFSGLSRPSAERMLQQIAPRKPERRTFRTFGR